MHTRMSYSNKRLKIEAHYALVEKKVTTAPFASSNNSDKSVFSCMHWRDNFSHMIKKIRLKDSTQPKVGSEGLKYDSSNKGKIASRTRKYGF
jgi:hypothetical protein